MKNYIYRFDISQVTWHYFSCIYEIHDYIVLSYYLYIYMLFIIYFCINVSQIYKKYIL